MACEGRLTQLEQFSRIHRQEIRSRFVMLAVTLAAAVLIALLLYPRLRGDQVLAALAGGAVSSLIGLPLKDIWERHKALRAIEGLRRAYAHIGDPPDDKVIELLDDGFKILLTRSLSG